MYSFIRLITGNTVPKWSNIDPPTKGEQLECGAYPVRLSAPAGMGSEDFSPKRLLFLLRGSISFCDTKGLWLAGPALLQAVNNQKQNSHTMFLGPNVEVTREDGLVSLQYVAWRGQNPENYCFNGVSLSKSSYWWRIQFDNEADAGQWEIDITAEIEASYLTVGVCSDLSMKGRRKLLDELIWLRIFRGNASLFYLYVSLTENGAAAEDRTDDGSGAVVFDRLFAFTKNLMDIGMPTFEETFAFVLDKASTFDNFDRVLLLMCDINQDVLANCDRIITSSIKLKKSKHALLQDTNNVVRFLTDFLAITHKYKHFRIREALLCAFHHSGAWTIPGPPSHSSDSDRPVVEWTKEFAWFKAVETDVRRIAIDSTNIELLLPQPVTEQSCKEASMYLLYLAVVQLCKSKHIEENSDRDFRAIHHIFVNVLEPEDIRMKFTALLNGDNVCAPHFVRLLLSTDLDTTDRTKIFMDMPVSNRMNNEVFRSVLAEGLLSHSYETLREAVCVILFDSQNFTEKDFEDNIKRIRDFPVVFAEELCKSSNVLGKSDFKPLLLSFALRAEGCTKRIESLEHTAVTTLSKWVESSQFADRSKQVKFSFMCIAFGEHNLNVMYCLLQIKKLLEDLQVVKYLRSAVSPVLHLFTEEPTVRSAVPRSSSASLSQSISEATTANRYSKDQLEDFIFGLMCISIAIKSGEFISFVDLFANFFETLFRPESRLRLLAVAHITAKFALRPEMRRKIESGIILNEGRHFHAAALDLMTLASSGIDDSLVSNLIVMALKLQDYDNMKRRVETVIYDLQGARDTKVPMMKIILSRIVQKKPEELGNISIEEIMCCVNNAVTALALLRNMEAEKMRLTQLFVHYLANDAVAAWPELFKSAHSIAMFIKYMGSEDIDKAYALFAERNTGHGNYLSSPSLLEKVKMMHPEPIVSALEIERIVNEGTSSEFVEALLQSVMNRETSTKNKDKNFIGAASVAWMRLMYAKMTIPMAPKNVQIITMLLCAQWLQRKPPGFGALIAQVGTGEGKSLIIAMLAAYCVKVLKKKVHILENNVGLLDKDYSTFCCSAKDKNGATSSFFAALNVSASKKLNEQADVTYCLRAGMETFYRDGVFAGKQPFNNTVLIVDEVDELIVDKDPNMSYVKEVTHSSGPLMEMFDLLHETKGTGLPRTTFDSQMWLEACAAFARAKRAKKNQNYKSYGGSNIFMIVHREVEKNLYGLWLEYLRYEADKSYRPHLQTTFFYQNITHLMTQYDAIVGLSGSLGGLSEQDFLRDAYKAKCFKVPPFLDTCKNVQKHAPILIRNVVEVHSGAAEHTEAIIRLALEKYRDVPVLIVTKSPEAARELAAAITSRLKSPAQRSLHGNFSAKEFVQVFVKYDEEGAHMPWLDIIDKATGEVGPGLAWRITVTDAFGGRGHDFLVHDQEVDERNGLALIVTLMPESERDWTQWIGRTARNDRKGQYAVILRADESPIDNNEALLAPHRISRTEYSIQLQDVLLTLRDAQNRKNIEAMQEKIMRGKRLNELCDHYYAKYNRDATGEWPGAKENEDLSLFLGNHSEHTERLIRKFAVSKNVIYTSKYNSN